MIIPRIIYYCWFGGEKPKNVLDCIQNWKEKLPEYEIIEINEYNKKIFDIEKECQNNLWFKTCYENKMWAYVADYARLKVLYERGGVYFDTDITVEKDITELLIKNKLILGCENNRSINGAVIISNINNPNIYKMLDFYNEDIWKTAIWAIPSIITKIIKKNYNWINGDNVYENSEILILPANYFYPVPYGENEKDKFIDEYSYTIHWWAASWHKSNVDYFLRHKHKVKLEKLLKQCFRDYVLFENPFLKIEKIHFSYKITIDFYFALRFKHRYYNKYKYLTIFILGVQVPLWRVKN